MTDPQVNKTSGRLKLIAVLSVFAVPFLIASLWFNQLKTGGESLESRANGQLLSPAQPLSPFEQNAVAGGVVQNLTHLQDQWSLLYFHADVCGETCVKRLYDSRQVRVSLGREMHRVRRVFVSDEQLGEELKQEHLQLLYAGGDGEEPGLKAQVRNAVGEAIFDADPGQLYLVDPLGNLMMRFPSDLPQKLMLKDLKVLLKASRIG